MAVTLYPTSHFSGKPTLPGDKSISHRALLFGALAKGTSEISNLLEGADIHSTWKCLEKLGIQISRKGDRIQIDGQGYQGLRSPTSPLDCGNSGTSIRLLMGALAGFPEPVTLIGDSSLSCRPMARIANPLREMGVKIQLKNENYPPVQLQGSRSLRGIQYSLPIASAQLKSALILAGLFTQGSTRLTGKIQSRDHTERLLPHFGVSIQTTPDQISIQGGQYLTAASVSVPGDLSSAAFWITAAAIVPKSHLELENVSLNPTRIGLLQVLKRMGVSIESEITDHHPEPVGRLRITSAPLQGITLESHEIPLLIDELPLIAVLATFAEGTTIVNGAEELRFKETDRIEAIAVNLRTMGVNIETTPDGFIISGPQRLRGAKIRTFDDHRIAMAFSIAALRAEGITEILESECVGVSYPNFYDTLHQLTQNF